MTSTKCPAPQGRRRRLVIAGCVRSGEPAEVGEAPVVGDRPDPCHPPARWVSENESGSLNRSGGVGGSTSGQSRPEKVQATVMTRRPILRNRAFLPVPQARPTREMRPAPEAKEARRPLHRRRHVRSRPMFPFAPDTVDRDRHVGVPVGGEPFPSTENLFECQSRGGKPTVTQRAEPPQCGFARAADVDRWVWLLNRFGPRKDGREIDEITMDSAVSWVQIILSARICSLSLAPRVAGSRR